MANSIKVSSRLERLRNNVSVQSPPLSQVTVATTSELAVDGVQVVGTTHELIAVGDVTDDAYMEVENLHATAAGANRWRCVWRFRSVVRYPSGIPGGSLSNRQHTGKHLSQVLGGIDSRPCEAC